MFVGFWITTCTANWNVAPEEQEAPPVVHAWTATLCGPTVSAGSFQTYVFVPVVVEATPVVS